MTGSRPDRRHTQHARRPTRHRTRTGPGPRRARRHPATVLALGLAGALSGLALAGCIAKPAQRPAADPRPTRSVWPAWNVLCPVQPSPSLTAELGRTVAESQDGEVIPLGTSADGNTAYVSAWTPGFSGVAALDLATGALRKIQPFQNPVDDQADGSSDGQWLAWEETYSLSSLDNFTVYAWDSAGGRLLTLGHSLAGPGGTAWPSPWHPPAVSGHYAAWAQGYGPGGEVEVRLADLATGQVRVIRQGHTQPPFFDQNLVVWPESDRPGTQTTLHALSLTTMRPAPLPRVLRAVHGTEFVVTDGTRTAYLNPAMTSLYYSPAQDVRAREVLRLPAGTYFAALAMGPGTLAWTTTAATYIASTNTGGYVKVTPEYGDATGSEAAVLISDAASQKVAHPILPLHVISPAQVTWPACPARAGR
jgi:hypothetical protein